jgi:hypothetical protein
MKAETEVIQWTYCLQLILQQMSEEEFTRYMEGKVIKMDGKLYGLTEKEKQ